MAFDFKKEEDVKDYLKNLEVQYNFGCHEEKNGEGRFFFSVGILLKLFLKRVIYSGILWKL